METGQKAPFEPPRREGPSRWVVLKFGGTSVASAARWEVIIQEARRVRAAEERPCVVVSAVSQVTNKLNACITEALSDPDSITKKGSAYEWIQTKHFKLAEDLGIAPDDEGMLPVRELLDELKRTLEGIGLTQEASPRLTARINAFGELMSSQLGLLAMRRAGVPCARLDARRLLKTTETAAQQDVDRFLNANVNPVKDLDLVESELRAQNAPDDAAVITQGFIGSNTKNCTCLLGRGGSDTSGALIAALLEATRLEIWTDVHGLFTSDPRHVMKTRLIHTCNYRVAQELASMGAKVLHPRCLVPASWAGIPVEVHNTEDADGPFTRIAGDDMSNSVVNVSKDGNKASVILAVTQRSGQVLINITNLNMWGEAGFLSRVFAPFGELDVSVDLVATSQYAVSLTLDHIPGGVKGDVFSRLLEKLKTMGTVTTNTSCAVVSVVGERLRNSLSELGRSLSETLADLENCEVHLMTQSSEDLNLSWVVDEDQAKALVQGLHNRLFTFGEAATDVLGQTWEELRSPAAGEACGVRRSWSGSDIGLGGKNQPSTPTTAKRTSWDGVPPVFTED